MSKIDWKDDIVFYVYKDYCSVFYYKGSSLLPLATESYFIPQGPVVRKPINANPRLIAYEGVYFSTPKCCSTLIFGKILH